jgi:hypothetical protein
LLGIDPESDPIAGSQRRGKQMGEAKVRRAALVADCLKHLEQWSKPATEWERSMAERLSAMDHIWASRLDAHVLSQMRMPKNQCHANAKWFAGKDSTATVVSGWWLQWPDYVLHSVVLKDGDYMCVTPVDMGDSPFPFVPDSEIEWLDDGDVWTATYRSQRLGTGIRRFPEFTLARTKIVRDRIQAGVHPYQAMQFTDEEMEQLKREHIPAEM